MNREGALLNGEITPAQVMHGFGKKHGQEVIENSSLSPLASHVKRLPMADALDMYDLGGVFVSSRAQ